MGHPPRIRPAGAHHLGACSGLFFFGGRSRESPLGSFFLFFFGPLGCSCFFGLLWLIQVFVQFAFHFFGVGLPTTGLDWFLMARGRFKGYQLIASEPAAMYLEVPLEHTTAQVRDW